MCYENNKLVSGLKIKMRYIFLILLVVSVWSCGYSGEFTQDERNIIGTDGGDVMRLWRIDSREDSSFLRRMALPLERGHLNTEAYRILKERMLATVNDTADQGVGIAAPQVGIGRQLIAVQRFDKSGEPFEFYANPRIVYYSEETVSGPEACLSVPEIMDSVRRSAYIVVSYNRESDFRELQDTVKGFTAVIFQHEADHLKGKLFIDYTPRRDTL